MTGRAVTDEQKRAIIGRVLAAWLRAPEFRRGQLITSAVLDPWEETDIFYIGDETLTAALEDFVSEFSR